MGVAGSVAGAPDANAITFTGGANKLTFTNATTGLTGNIGVTGSLTFDQSGIDTTVGNVITGSGSVVKTGTHTITLSGANTYTGGTTSTADPCVDRRGTLGATTISATLNGATAVLGLGGTTQRGWRRGATRRAPEPSPGTRAAADVRHQRVRDDGVPGDRRHGRIDQDHRRAR